MRRVQSYLSTAMAVGAIVAAGAAYAATAPKPGKKAPQESARPADGHNIQGDKEATEQSERATGKKAYPADYRPPIAYGKDIVGVTPDGTLSVRYRGDWNDIWGKELASYLAEAKRNAAARGTQTKKVLFAAPILKNCEVTAGNGTLGSDGKPLRGHYSMPEAQQQNLRKEAKRLVDFFYAASDGEVTVEVIFPVLDGLKVNTGPAKTAFLIWARGLQDQLLPMLKQYENAGVIMWIFVTGDPEVENPKVDAKGKKQRFGRGPYGISFPAWPLYGGYTMSTTGASAGLWVHEFNHRWLDGLKNHEGVALTRNHSLGQLGFAPGHSLDESYFATYRYIIRPAMWKRFSITTPNHTPLEPFSGKAYAWSDVQDDCWFKLPELHNAELAKLTGIDSFEIDVKYGGGARLFKVVEADRSKVLSKYIEPPVPVKVKKGKAPPAGPAPDPIPVQLDNYIQTGKESCAVVKTATGQWLFVSANMADLYADMLKISGKGNKPLGVYGYVNEGILPLLLVKAPADMALPTCEEGFFREPMPAKSSG